MSPRTVPNPGITAARGHASVGAAGAERPLRIALLAPMAGPVQRDSSESIEQLVWLLAEGLVERGQQVTLFAAGDSQTSARLEARYEKGYVHDDRLPDWLLHELLHTAAAFEHAAEFDIIHSHNYYYPLAFSELTSTPLACTYHVQPSEDVAQAFAEHPEVELVATSQYQWRELGHRPEVAIVHHGVETSRFPFSSEPGDYLLYLGRLTPNKGPREAIRIAQATGMRLIMAGSGEAYFKDELAPLVGRARVEYVGTVSGVERNRLLMGAAVLLYPLRHPEPFGLVMIEAMACGTPVAAFDVGTVREIVTPGLTGYCEHDVDALVRRIPAAIALDRVRIRAEAAARFDASRMVDDYFSVYQRAIGRRLRRTR